MIVLLYALAAAWCLFSLVAVVTLLGVRALPEADCSAAAGAGPLPRVTAIIAARDEQSRIRDTVERLLRQEEIDLDLTIVDDRSTDATAAILDELKVEHPRLNVRRVDRLPQGWLGKPHACHLGAREATGDWLLFSDADVWMSANLVSRALRTALRDGVQHLAMFPGEERATLPARAALTLIMTATAPVPALVNRDVAGAGAGIGAFNLVRADAYRKSGGYERLRMEVVDDLKLGLILRQAGSRSRIYDANRDMKIHWAADLVGLIRAVDKNMFAMFAFNAWLAALGVTAPLLIWCATLLAPLAWPACGAAAVAPVAGMATAWIPALIVTRRGRLGLGAALLSPLMLPVLAAMILHSTVKALREGGIRWRNTFYPLAELRRGRVPAVLSSARRNVITHGRGHHDERP